VADITNRPTLLLVHGGFHGPWGWQKLEKELAADDWVTQTVKLPSAVKEEAPTEPLPGMYDDARVIRAALDGIDGPVVVVAHSYGGIPATQATVGAANVSHIVYLAAYVLDAGEAMFPFHGVPAPDSLAGTLPVEDLALNKVPIPYFFGDVEPAEAAEAAARLVPQSVRSAYEPVTQVGWRTIPSSFIMADNDQTHVRLVAEQMAARTGAVYHLPSHHEPFLSMPTELAALLTRIVDNIPAK
jgi:pimeloyl-ACP methyl ester carboxylesterase